MPYLTKKFMIKFESSFEHRYFGVVERHISLFLCRYVCHAEVNAILNKNHASARGQVFIFPVKELPKCLSFSLFPQKLLCFCYLLEMLLATPNKEQLHVLIFTSFMVNFYFADYVKRLYFSFLCSDFRIVYPIF